ncbi:MAG: pantoate--beta-alanine ligase [Bacteroidota bacterium]
MLKFDTVETLNAYLQELKNDGCKIGFIPTMGALHQGHLSLINRAKEDKVKTVCSVFVNPIQFNNSNDLKNYPRTLDADVDLLESVGCDALFFPSVDEIYPNKVNTFYNFGYLETTMEGAHRKGHFNGMAVVVKRLFDIVKPDFAYFGEKDYQQLTIVKMMVKMLNLPIRIVGCPIIREADGLAMSSRNVHLSAQEKTDAVLISQTLMEAKEMIKTKSMHEVKEWAINNLKSNPAIELEYFEIADGTYLKPVIDKMDGESIRAFIALKIGKTRLIDTMELIGAKA